MDAQDHKAKVEDENKIPGVHLSLRISTNTIVSVLSIIFQRIHLFTTMGTSLPSSFDTQLVTVFFMEFEKNLI